MVVNKSQAKETKHECTNIQCAPVRRQNEINWPLIVSFSFEHITTAEV